MDPAIIGKKIKQTWTNGVASDGRSYSSIPDNELGSMYILKHGDKAYSSLGLAAPTAEDTKQANKQGNTERILNQLEEIYFRNNKPLAYGQYGLAGRLPGVGKNIEKVVAPSPETDRITEYRRTLESSRPFLARAAGDVGNLALQEQLVAGRGLADITDTPAEAISLFKSARQKLLGLSPSERLSKFEKQLKGQKPTGPTQLNLDQALQSGGLTMNDKQAGMIDQSSQPQPSPQGMSFLERARQGARAAQNPEPNVLADILFPRTAELQRKTNRGEQISFDERVGGAGEAAANALTALPGGQLSLPVRFALAGALRGGTTSGANIGERAKSAAIQGVVGGGLGKVGQALPRFLIPTKTGNEIRNKAIATAELTGKEIDGRKIVAAMEEWSKNALKANPGSEQQINQIMAETIKQYGVDVLGPQQAFDVWRLVDSGYTRSGIQKTSVGAEADLAMRNILKKELDKIAPGFERGTRLIGEGLSRAKFLSRLVYPSAIGAGIGVPVSIGIGKALGQGRQ